MGCVNTFKYVMRCTNLHFSWFCNFRTFAKYLRSPDAMIRLLKSKYTKNRLHTFHTLLLSIILLCHIAWNLVWRILCEFGVRGGVCVFRLAKIPSNAPLVLKNGWKIILMTESCWEWYKVHFYTKTLDINIMLTFSTQKIRFCMKLHKKKNCMIVYHPDS